MVNDPATATTTAEQDKHTAGRRRINVIWEVTQSAIALAVTLTALYTSTIMTLRTDPDKAALALLSNAFFLVIGFYFGRTNHERPGGVPRDSAGS